MFRTLTAAVVALGLALGGVAATPAEAQSRSGNRDLQRLLGGVATVIILGAAYDHLRDKRKDKSRIETRHARSPQYYEPTRRYDPDHRRNYRRDDRHDSRRDSRIVPAQCLRQVDTRGGTQRFFAARCLERTMANANRLPQQCAIQVPGDRGNRWGYAPRCLRDYGWRRG